VADLHERLLGNLAEILTLDGWEDQVDERLRALRAVVELHAPIQLVLAGTPDQFIRCRECPGGCDTITAIARELGVEIGETP
jgi:hypothetical protein